MARRRRTTRDYGSLTFHPQQQLPLVNHVKVRTMNKLGGCAKRKHITLERYIKELQAVIT
jgi:hypothetical protein